MENCIFCKIVAESIPSYKVYENELFFGFLDVFPKTKGHTLIIPKKHYRWVYDVPEFGAYWEAARTVTIAIQKALHPKWITYFTYGSIPHAHIHILPRYEVITADNPNHAQLLPNDTISMSREDLQTLVKRISKELK